MSFDEVLKRFLILFSVILFASSPLLADSAVDWRLQAVENFEKADAELNRVYQLAIETIQKNETMPPEIKKAWIEQQRRAQRAWIEFRDADATVVEYSWHGGSGMPAAQWGWKQKLTEKRIDDLKEQYQIQ